MEASLSTQDASRSSSATAIVVENKPAPPQAPSWLLSFRARVWGLIKDILEVITSLTALILSFVFVDLFCVADLKHKSFFMQDFQPWLWWIVFDALFTIVVKCLAQRVARLRPFFGTLGWL